MSRAKALRRLYDEYGAPIVDDIAEALGDLFEVKPRPKPRQKPEIRRDNPGGEWEARKRAYAQEAAQRQGRPSFGAITAYTKKPITVDPQKVRSIPGARGERRVPGESQYDQLRPAIEKEGFDPSAPVLIGIDYRGEPYILEGNTRTAVASDLGIPEIPAEVRWFDGGENVEYSQLRPSDLEGLMSPSGLMRDPNFARWFEGSKAVDEYGEPLMLTHGTLSGQINEFRPGSHFGTPLQANTRIEALTENLAELKNWPGYTDIVEMKKVIDRKYPNLGRERPTNIPVYLSVQNPKRMEDHLGNSWEDRIRVARDEGYDSIVYLNRAELSDDAHDAILKEELQRGASLTDDEIRALVPEVADSYVIFDPRQVKSATGNRGTYDPDNPDIGMKKGGLAAKPIWDKKRPKKLGKPKSLSAKKKKAAKARAKAAGRPYPNMVDNLAVARKKGK